MKKIPAFQVRGIPKTAEAFRELPTNAFKILIDLAFRYAPDIVFALCLQAFAGLRAGEVCNVRQEGNPIGNGLLFTRLRIGQLKLKLISHAKCPCAAMVFLRKNQERA
jgi:hypothetical protein